MLISLSGHTASARRSGEESALKKIRLINILNRNSLFIDRCSQRFQSDGPAAVKVNNAPQHPAVDRVEAELIDLKPRERFICNIACDHAVRAYLRIIAHTTQQTVCDSRCASRTRGNLQRTGFFDLYAV